MFKAILFAALFALIYLFLSGWIHSGDLGWFWPFNHEAFNWFDEIDRQSLLAVILASGGVFTYYDQIKTRRLSHLPHMQLYIRKIRDQAKANAMQDWSFGVNTSDFDAEEKTRIWPEKDLGRAPFYFETIVISDATASSYKIAIFSTKDGNEYEVKQQYESAGPHDAQRFRLDLDLSHLDRHFIESLVARVDISSTEGDKSVAYFQVNDVLDDQFRMISARQYRKLKRAARKTKADKQ